MRKIVLVGQAPSSNSDPDEAFSGASGEIIRRLIGISREEFEEDFDRINVLERFPGKNGKGDAFSARLVSPTRRRFLMKFVNDRNVVFFGRETARVFGIDPKILVLDLFLVKGTCFRGLVVPHPSGINLFWNSVSNKNRAKAALRDFVQLYG